jgi:hypothetical protein
MNGYRYTLSLLMCATLFTGCYCQQQRIQEQQQLQPQQEKQQLQQQQQTATSPLRGVGQLLSSPRSVSSYSSESLADSDKSDNGITSTDAAVKYQSDRDYTSQVQDSEVISSRGPANQRLSRTETENENLVAGSTKTFSAVNPGTSVGAGGGLRGSQESALLSSSGMEVEGIGDRLNGNLMNKANIVRQSNEEGVEDPNNLLNTAGNVRQPLNGISNQEVRGSFTGPSKSFVYPDHVQGYSTGSSSSSAQGRLVDDTSSKNLISQRNQDNIEVNTQYQATRLGIGDSGQVNLDTSSSVQGMGSQLKNFQISDQQINSLDSSNSQTNELPSNEAMPSVSSLNSQGNLPSKPKHGKFDIQEDTAECKPLEPQEIPVSPTWLSSYPGSGSKMVWRLIESITGLSTGDDIDSNGQLSKAVAVTVKTHYPAHAPEDLFKSKTLKKINSAILLIRSPMFAIPAYFRIQYRQKNDSLMPSEEPPTKSWISWRNENFDSELSLWVKLVNWWMENYDRDNLHVLPYEYISSPKKGSDELQKLGNFLGSVDQVIASHLIEPEKFCCIWEMLVDKSKVLQSTKKKKPIYTAEQLEAMIQALVKIRDNSKSFPEFYKLMDEYLGNIVATKRAVMTRKGKNG